MQLLVFKRGVLPSVVMRIIRHIMLLKFSIASPCLKQLPKSGILAIAWSSDDRFLACGSDDGIVRVYKGGGDFPLLKSIACHTNSVCALAFSGNGSFLASGGHDQRVIVMDVTKEFSRVANLNCHASGVSAVCFSPDSMWLLLGHADGTMIKYSVVGVNFPEVLTMKPHSRGLCFLSICAIGDRVASSSRDRTVDVYTGSLLRTVKTLTDHTDRVNVVSFSGDGRWFASGSDDRDVMVYDWRKDFALVTIIDDDAWINCLCFTSNSGHLLTCSYKGIKVYDCNDDFALIQSLDRAHKDIVWSLCIGRQYLASRDDADTVKVWALGYK
jgi:WD40 repeat protein